MTDREQIAQLYRDYWTAMIGKDVPALDDMMAEDYELRHMTGLRQGKESFFASLCGGELNYFAANHDEILVEVNGDTATLVGRTRVEAAVYGGRTNWWRLQGDFTLRKEDGEWKFVSSRASTY